MSIIGLYSYDPTIFDSVTALSATVTDADGVEHTAPAGVAHFLEHKMFDLPGGRDVSAEFAAMGASTNSHFCDQYRFPGQLCATADYAMLRDAVAAAEKLGVRADVGQVFTADQFYNDNSEAAGTYRKFGILAVEMETAGLYWTAQRLGKKALSILTISDHIFTGEALSAEERQDSFHEMMEIALETAWKAAE